jgi:glucose-1-phosphatase
VQAFGLSLTPSAFLQEFRTWLRGPYAGAFELVAEVRDRAVVACLSNTNSLDVARFRGELGLNRHFDCCYFSNEIGRRKPAPECYAYVLEHLGFAAEPRRVAFFDDSADCVQGARAAGMVAYQVADVSSVRRHLESLGLVALPSTNCLGPAPTTNDTDGDGPGARPEGTRSDKDVSKLLETL